MNQYLSVIVTNTKLYNDTILGAMWDTSEISEHSERDVAKKQNIAQF